MVENWIIVPGYENYMVSDLGRVKSLPRKVTMFHGFCYFTKERFLSADVLRNGYQRVAICKDGKRISFLLHRLVLLSFIGNPPKDKNQCLHLNHNKLDNRLSNLKWGSGSENIRMDYDRGIRTPPMKGRRNDKRFSQPVTQSLTDGTVVKTFPSMMEAERQTGIKLFKISLCCNGRQKTTAGFIFERT